MTIAGYDEYSSPAEYLHLLSMAVWDDLGSTVAAHLAGVDPDSGTVLELGAGTGLGTGILLDAIPDAPVLVAEPSAHLRAVLLARLADRWDGDRVTVYPGGASDLPLPDRIAAVVGMHMIGHLRPDERRALLAALIPRLVPGAPVVLNVQPPDTAVEVPLTPPASRRLGRLRYEGQGRAEPVGPESVRWIMSYRTWDGDTVLAEVMAEYEWWVVSAAALAAELAAAGLEVAEPDGHLVVGRQPHA